MTENKRWTPGAGNTTYAKDKNIDFQLINEEVKEQFTIWPKYNTTLESYNMADGTEVTFPIREGALKGTDGNAYNVQTEIKIMPKEIFEELFPKLGKNTKYIRHIYQVTMDGENIIRAKVLYGFTFSAHKKITSLIENMRGMGNNPLEFLWEQTFDRQKAAVNMYTVGIKKNIGIPQVEESTPQGSVSEVQEIMIEGPNEKVKAIIQTIKNAALPKEAWLGVFKGNGIEGEEAKELIQKHMGVTL